MKKLIKKLPSKAIIALLIAAGLLLLSGSVGGTRAALTYYSDVYSSRVELGNIGVTLWESGEMDGVTNESGETGDTWNKIAFRDYDHDGLWSTESGELLSTMLPEDDEEDSGDLQIGRKYKERLKVQNTGKIDEYVRVSVYKYWTDGSGENRNRELDPEYIVLDLFAEDDAEDWLVDEEASTKERTVLYYRNILSVNEETSPFVNAVKIDPAVSNLVTQETVSTTKTTTEGGTETLTQIKSTYVYDDKQFCIDVEVDAVQDHNAKEAILSAWGKDVELDADGSIERLNN